VITVREVFPNLFTVAAPYRREIQFLTAHENLQQFGLRFDDILKTFFNDILKNVLSHGIPEYCKWHPSMLGHPGW